MERIANQNAIGITHRLIVTQLAVQLCQFAQSNALAILVTLGMILQ